jgi:hypothetical protein
MRSEQWESNLQRLVRIQMTLTTISNCYDFFVKDLGLSVGVGLLSTLKWWTCLGNCRIVIVWWSTTHVDIATLRQHSTICAYLNRYLFKHTSISITFSSKGPGINLIFIRGCLRPWPTSMQDHWVLLGWRRWIYVYITSLGIRRGYELLTVYGRRVSCNFWTFVVP